MIHNFLLFLNTAFVKTVMEGLCQQVLEKSDSSKKLNCSVVIPANRSSTLMVNLPKDLNQWRQKDRIPDERKYVIYNHNSNSLIKAPFGVVTAFPDHPNPVFNSPSSSYLPSNSSSQIDLKCAFPNSNRSNSIGTT